MDRKFPGDVAVFGLTNFTLTLLIWGNVLGEVMLNRRISVEIMLYPSVR